MQLVHENNSVFEKIRTKTWEYTNFNEQSDGHEALKGRLSIYLQRLLAEISRPSWLANEE